MTDNTGIVDSEATKSSGIRHAFKSAQVSPQLHRLFVQTQDFERLRKQPPIAP